MIDPIQVLWSPAGLSMPSLGARALVDVTDGDTPNIRMPIRMLSVDTPEVTARTPDGAAKVDKKFLQLAEWMRERPADVPISARLSKVLEPKLATGSAGTLHFTQGKSASAFEHENIDKRLRKDPPNEDEKRNLFIRIADAPFDNNNRLLAYIAPNYSTTELAKLTRAQRGTFNLDLIAAGWAAPFILYPSIPGELDLPLFLEAAAAAVKGKKGIWSDKNTLLAYEYRAMEKLFSIAKKGIEDGKPVTGAARYGWRERYCADLRTRVLHGPEDYIDVPPVYRLWIWPADVQTAIGTLNLTPAPRLVSAD
ncbi:thermonuclease family protein [Tenggerimyces flavus]|uniref:Thermonuclease family protein n=1 Tax=Tenggerimyces flavus TaxID=1708749 RepID=A0ABV7Y8L9_9ACTN|nr:thermonuclease family protein [Tenggerimyces flavus]MBM7788433.1 endonuclease YncB(thermonuclease family) [Tenggerimyces flavus]